MTSFLAATVGALVGAVPTVTGLLFFLDPILRKKSDGESAEEGFIALDTAVDAIPNDGTPQLVTVFADKVDAWNKFNRVPIGTVWLRKKDDELVAFNTICPHIGCSVDYRQSNNDFFCPCHTSTFDVDGERTNKIPPRGMDTLETKIVDGKVQVKYQRFRTAIPEKVPVA